jgi:hypothetical protein
MFLANFYCYLEHNNKNDFVIDHDNVWNWLGFNQKYNAKCALEKILQIIQIIKSCFCRNKSTMIRRLENAIKYNIKSNLYYIIKKLKC